MPIKNHYFSRRGELPRDAKIALSLIFGRGELLRDPDIVLPLNIRGSQELAPPTERCAYQFLSGERTRPRVQRLTPRRPHEERCHRRGRRWLHARRVCSPEIAQSLIFRRGERLRDPDIALPLNIRGSQEFAPPEDRSGARDSAGQECFSLLRSLTSSLWTGGQHAF
jgi:hypothetical protein